MLKFIKKRSLKKGAAPGTLIHIGERRIEKALISRMRYGPEFLKEEESLSVEALFIQKDFQGIDWINIDGIHDVTLIEEIGSRFGIHSLTLEDILNTDQRAKVEPFENYAFFAFKMLQYDSKKEEIVSEHVSLILGSQFLVSFQELPGDVFTPVRDRIRNGRGHIRKSGPGYLAYALMDAAVDAYFTILEKIAEHIEILEEKLFTDPVAGTLQSIHQIKREMIYMRKQVWPTREMLNALIRGDVEQVEDDTKIFLKDVLDHTIQVMDTIESYRDILSGMADLYLSTISNRMNEVMKVLTIIATLFIPITFIAGVYGMNFEFMPELKWRWGYLWAWGLMTGVALAMLAYFKRNRWF